MQEILETAAIIEVHLNEFITNLTSPWADFFKFSDRMISGQELLAIGLDNYELYAENKVLGSYENVINI